MLRRFTRLHVSSAEERSLDAYIENDSHAEAAAALGISLRTHQRHLESARRKNGHMPTHRLVAIRAQERGVTPKARKAEPEQDGLWAA